jgi:hypothetical protein
MNDEASNLIDRLNRQPIVELDVAEWEEIADQFEVTERHSTFIAGELLILRLEPGYAAVEQPAEDRRVVRRLENSDAVRSFVTSRLEEYERMWDGCGCKIDYYS